MAGKWFTVFDECAPRYVYLSPQEEQCASSSWGDSKIYTFGSIASLQRMPTEIKRCYSSNMDFSGKWCCQTFKGI